MSAAALRLPPLPTIRDLVRLYKLRALKQLSQNFLLDERITDRIVWSAGDLRGKHVCEVGPGPGGITRSILRRGPKRLIVVEKDPRFVPTLELLEEACRGRTELVVEIGDVRSYNFEAGFARVRKCDWYEAPPPIHIIGNLPFNVSTNLLVRWLDSISQRSSAWSFGRVPMTLTFQKEVAERMTAGVSSAQRCRLSVMCQLWCDVEHRFTIPGRAFLPKPDVDVGVVVLRPKKYPVVKLPFLTVEKVVRCVFNMRQKYCRRGAEVLFPEGLRDDLGPRLFRLADVDYTARPFELTNEEFARLCYAYAAICEETPEIGSFDFRAAKV